MWSAQNISLIVWLIPFHVNAVGQEPWEERFRRFTLVSELGNILVEFHVVERIARSAALRQAEMIARRNKATRIIVEP